jgi:hypothetical protein
MWIDQQCVNTHENIHRGSIKIKIYDAYIFSFMHYKFRKLQKYEIDILVELGQLENIFHPQE